MKHIFFVLLLILASTFTIPVFSEDADDCAYTLPSGTQLLPLYDSGDIGGLVLGSILAKLEQLELCRNEKLDDNQGPQPHAFLKRAIDLDDTNILLLQRLSAYCSWGESLADRSDICGRELGKSLTDQDPGNGLFWIYYSTAQFLKEHKAVALQFLVTAANSPRMRVNLIEQALELKSAMDAYFPDYRGNSTEIAIGMAAANFPGVQPLFDMCRNQILDDPKWQQACLDVGYAMESKSNTLMTVMLGLELQRVVYDLIGESDNLAATQERKKQLNDLADRYTEALAEMEATEAFAQLWMTDFLNYGELEAMELAIKRSSSTLK